jgi:hypothetical protein
MKITREQLRTIVGEVLQEEKDYQSFFKAMLKKAWCIFTRRIQIR